MVFTMDVRFRHSFHEIESLDIPNILFPSQCRKLYQVIGIGIQEEFRNPYVIIKRATWFRYIPITRRIINMGAEQIITC